MAWRFSRRPPVADDFSDLLVFGYSCKIFRDGEKAEWVQSGRNLVPHPHETDNLMDRHDCRLHLLDVWNCEYDGQAEEDDEKEAETQFEKDLDEERYKDMLTDDQLNELHMEEELKRLAAQTGAGGAEMEYNYEANGGKEVKEESDEEVDEPYIPLPQLKVPKGTTMPKTVRENAILEKTAAFIASQGVQMEIVLKAKQKDAEKFDFLHFDHPLNGYYRHVTKMIREGKYTPVPHVPKKKEKIKVEEEDEDSDSDSSGHYLHPSLLGGNKNNGKEEPKKEVPRPVLPTIAYKLGEEDDVYSALFNNLSALMPKKQEEEIVDQDETDQHVPQAPPQEFAQWYQWFYGGDPPYEHQQKVIPPPPSLQAVVDKTADFVAKYGPKAEQHLRSRAELQLDFLDHDHMYYPYYQLKIRWTQYDDYMKSQYAAHGIDPANMMPSTSIHYSHSEPALGTAVAHSAEYSKIRDTPYPQPQPALLPAHPTPAAPAATYSVPPPFPHLLNRYPEGPANPGTPTPPHSAAGTPPPPEMKKRRSFYDLPTEGAGVAGSPVPAVQVATRSPVPVSFAIGQTKNEDTKVLLPKPKELTNAESSGEEDSAAPEKVEQENAAQRRRRKRRFDVPPAGFEVAPPVLIVGQTPFVPPTIPPIPKRTKPTEISDDLFDVDQSIEKAVDSQKDPQDKELQMQRKLRAQMFLNKLKARKGATVDKHSDKEGKQMDRSRSRSPITSYP